ncbi:MAG: rhomboid family intramembrane serine protease [Planctomycetota bacterium]|nr:MAG: rhomboid family intramembrane serine protease [Planctomycetota bacterium]REJ96572.1 MAG: rhomboid family intramembrane serine protease [Planctomycetota bacterium]REK21744.1 MAG: rhomboid family intramembrane serine protease [Planctomycetota bacterium]REK43150.1 MAG: rhomboid family intramembrane serine protease [Planctomycetota bacterium]
MRRAGTIDDREQAQRFADYLLTQGIPSRVEEASGGGGGSAKTPTWAVWIIDEEHLETARSELADFRIDPAAAKYRGAAKPAENLRREEKKRVEQLNRNIVDVRRRWQGRHVGPHPFTIGLIAVTVAITLAVWFGDKEKQLSYWLNFAPLEPVATDRGLEVLLADDAFRTIASGEFWRLATPMFMHGGWLHLFFNMYMTYQLGGLVETRRGPWRFLLIVVATGIAANVTQYLWGQNFGPFRPHVMNFLGMSGVVYGLFGYAWMKSRFDPSAGIFLPPNLVVWLLLWFGLCTFGFLGERIANGAHAGGLVAGMALGYAPILWRKLTD